MAEAVGDTPWCTAHNPTTAGRERHKEISARGGRAAHAPSEPLGITVRVDSPEAILEAIRETAQAVLDRRLGRSEANTVSYLLSSAVATRKLLHTEERLRRIESRLGINQSPLAEDEDTEDHAGQDLES